MEKLKNFLSRTSGDLLISLGILLIFLGAFQIF